MAKHNKIHLRLTPVFTAIICLFFALTCYGCSGVFQQNSASFSEANPSLIPTYEHYDPTSFYQQCEELSLQAESTDSISALSLYDQLYHELEHLSTLTSIAYLQSCETSGNKELENEYSYSDDTLTECSDRFFQAAQKLASGPLAKEFKTHLNNDSIFEDIADYSALSQEEKDLSSRETVLINEYYSALADLSVYTYDYKGKTYSFEDMKNSILISTLSTEDYFTIYSGCMKSLNDHVGTIFLELVSLRTQIAQINGFENYAQYADEQLYHRDYSEEDLKAFKEAVKTSSKNIANIDYQSLFGANISYNTSTSELLQDCVTLMKETSGTASDALDYLCKNSLYSIGRDSSRMDSGFTCSLFYPTKTAFIYNTTYGSLSDLSDTIHELGHFTNFTRSQTSFLEDFYTVMDIAEIHSTGLELLSTHYYNSLLDEKDASLAAAQTLYKCTNAIFAGCIYDDWQRIVYQNPTMTLDEINQAFVQVCTSYEASSIEDNSSALAYEWLLVHHNFDSPLYYISYSVSYYASLQLWEQSNNDYLKALQIWETLVSSKPIQGYCETISSINLAPLTDKEAVEQVFLNTSSFINGVLQKQNS